MLGQSLSVSQLFSIALTSAKNTSNTYLTWESAEKRSAILVLPGDRPALGTDGHRAPRQPRDERGLL